MRNLLLSIVLTVCFIALSCSNDKEVKPIPVDKESWNSLSKEILKEYQKKGMDINAPAYNGDSPLHLALNGGLTLWNPEVAKLLLDEKKVALEQKNSDGETPLMVAMHNPPTLYLTEVPSGKKVLTDAAAEYEEMIQLLVDKGANVKARNSMNFSLLHYATYFGSTKEAVRILLDAGAPLNGKTATGETALFFGFDTTLHNLLIDKGLDINATNNQGETILHFTLERLTDPDHVPYLLSKGCNKELLNAKGESALDIAVRAREWYSERLDESSHYVELLSYYDEAVSILSE